MTSCHSSGDGLFHLCGRVLYFRRLLSLSLSLSLSLRSFHFPDENKGNTVKKKEGTDKIEQKRTGASKREEPSQKKKNKEFNRTWKEVEENQVNLSLLFLCLFPSSFCWLAWNLVRKQSGEDQSTPLEYVFTQAKASVFHFTHVLKLVRRVKGIIRIQGEGCWFFFLSRPRFSLSNPTPTYPPIRCFAIGTDSTDGNLRNNWYPASSAGTLAVWKRRKGRIYSFTCDSKCYSIFVWRWIPYWSRLW